MVIHVHRESGLANRTYILTTRRVRTLRLALLVGGGALILGVGSWAFLAAQAARVPFLNTRVATLQRSAERLDTLQLALAELEKRHAQLQLMLGAPIAADAQTNPALRAIARDDSAPPTLWPSALPGRVVSDQSNATSNALIIALPAGTAVRAVAGGQVADVSSDGAGARRVRLVHADGHESLYANLADVEVSRGERVAAGTRVGTSGTARRSSVPHLRFELRRAGASIDPVPLLREGAPDGHLR